jgi:hypothetical protein
MVLDYITAMAKFIRLMPPEIRYDILGRLDDLSLMVLKHVLLGKPLEQVKYFKRNQGAYHHGLKFFLWCYRLE